MPFFKVILVIKDTNEIPFTSQEVIEYFENLPTRGKQELIVFVVEKTEENPYE